MARHKVSIRAVLGRILLINLPAATVLAVLVAITPLTIQPAAIGLAALLAATGLPLYPVIRDLLVVKEHTRGLALEELPPPEISGSGLPGDIAFAVGQLRRNWSKENDDLKAQALANQTILDSLPDPLVTLDENRVVVRANLAARRVFSRSLAERDLATVVRDPCVLEAVDSVLEGEPGTEVALTLPVPVERAFRVRVEPLPARAADGTVAVLTLFDVTAMKRMEQMRADFVANASHELRTPLSALTGFIETLQGPARDDPEAQTRFLSIMYDQAHRMSRLVEDLLSLSRIELNEHTLPDGEADLVNVISSVTEGLELMARERGMTLALNLAENLPDSIPGQAEELDQVFSNLVENAIKYGEANTRISISAKLVQRRPADIPSDIPPPFVSVAVKNKGEGIAKEHLPRLTERFYRVDTARSRQMGGTGLGLAIVKHIVNRHRGALNVKSTIGKGATFTVYLPSHRDQPNLVDIEPPRAVSAG